MSFTPPPYPYERLQSLKDIAESNYGEAIDCSIGTPVDNPPAFVADVLAKSQNLRGYPSSVGSDLFRSAAANWMERRFEVSIDPASVAACIGTKEFVGTTAGYLHLRNPDKDTVLYPAVSYPTYAMGATLAGLRAVAVPMRNGRLDLDSIAKSDVERALMLWSNSPSNPTGRIDDLGFHANWGRQHGVLVASDECYSEFTWSASPQSILQHGSEGVIAVHSISKRSNLAGLRAGFYAGDSDVVAFLRLVRQHAGFMIPGPVQEAVAKAYMDDAHVSTQRALYLERLEILVKGLREYGIESEMPEGTFYVWCHQPGRNGWELAADLARDAGVVTSPGEFYGTQSNEFVRIAVVQPTDRITTVAQRLSAHARQAR